MIIGSTGCGKTTQVPQFIFDEAVKAGHGGRTSIVCTQPRRISATSVAQRVAQERAEPIGATVGYQIRLESVKSNQTHLLFCTTGAPRRLTSSLDIAHASSVASEMGQRSPFPSLLRRSRVHTRPRAA